MNNSLETDSVDRSEKRKKIIASQIQRELYSFFDENKDKLKRKRAKKSSNTLDTILQNRWFLVIWALTVALFLSIVTLFILDILKWLIQFLSISFLGLLLGFITYLFWKELQLLFLSVKQSARLAISNAAAYSVNPYDKIIEKLGDNFYADDLLREELRFKLILEDRRKKANLIQKITLLLSISIVAFAIFIFGSPEEGTEIDLLSGTIVGLSGISLVLKVFLDILFEWLFQQYIDIYSKCILILQNAQIIAKEEESDALRAYDEAILSNEEAIPFEQAIAEIEQNR